MSEFVVYQSYTGEDAAAPLLALLRARDIPFETELDAGQPVFDNTFANNRSFTQFIVKLHPGDMEWVRRLEAEANQDAVARMSPDHYLFGFSDAELMEILSKPDEWSNLDVALAGQLLRQRGRDVSPDTIRLLQVNRLREQAKPEESRTGWIVFGYLSALLGGFAGICIGIHLFMHRKTLSNGHRVYAFSAKDRSHGARILGLGILMFMVLLVSRVLSAEY